MGGARGEEVKNRVAVTGTEYDEILKTLKFSRGESGLVFTGRSLIEKW